MHLDSEKKIKAPTFPFNGKASEAIKINEEDYLRKSL